MTNFAMQRYVSRRLPRRPADFDWHVVATAAHADAWERHRPDLPLAAARLYEFGAGYDLIGAASMWAFGVERQTLCDIRPNLRPLLVHHTMRLLRERRAVLEERTGRTLREIPAELADAPVPEVLDALGIEYLAPADARDMPVEPASFDLAVSTFTLEHIPGPDLVEVLRECGRVLAPGGMVSAQVDLKDHFSYIDGSVGPFNFLRYSDARWRWLNPPLHYQSRLRWPDYEAVFAAAGLEAAETELTPIEAEERDRAAALPLDARFRRFTLDELTVDRAHAVLRPAARS
jgi:SAM-dependent methyltransferase